MKCSIFTLFSWFQITARGWEYQKPIQLPAHALSFRTLTEQISAAKQINGRLIDSIRHPKAKFRTFYFCATFSWFRITRRIAHEIWSVSLVNAKIIPNQFEMFQELLFNINIAFEYSSVLCFFSLWLVGGETSDFAKDINIKLKMRFICIYGIKMDIIVQK